MLSWLFWLMCSNAKESVSSGYNLQELSLFTVHALKMWLFSQYEIIRH